MFPAPLTMAERAALGDLKTWLTGRFGVRLDALVIFGSRARGEGHEHSDVDVLVTARGLTSSEAREIGYLAGDLLTKHDVVVSPFALSSERYQDLRDRERRIVAEIDRDGVPL
jgi:predicted nucleotidyltransferase